MSAYIEARERACDAIAALLIEWNRLDGDGYEHPVIYDTGKIGRYTESPLFDAAVGTFLAALPPSIVVDGKVVDMTAAHRVVAASNGEELEDVNDIAELWTKQLLDAAREVAE